MKDIFFSLLQRYRVRILACLLALTVFVGAFSYVHATQAHRTRYQSQVTFYVEDEKEAHTVAKLLCESAFEELLARTYTDVYDVDRIPNHWLETFVHRRAQLVTLHVEAKGAQYAYRIADLAVGLAPVRFSELDISVRVAETPVMDHSPVNLAEPLGFSLLCVLICLAVCVLLGGGAFLLCARGVFRERLQEGQSQDLLDTLSK